MCTLISVLCKYGVLEGQQNTIQTCVLSYLYCVKYSVLEGQQNTIQTCVLSYLYCVSMVYQSANRIQYKHVYSHICTVQVQCTRGAIEYNTNMCTLISVLCEYGVLEGQQNTIQTCVLSYLYCASTVYQRSNRIQYKHVYSRTCTAQVQCTRGDIEYSTNMYSRTCTVKVWCTRGAIEYNTNMCTLISVLCKYGVLEGQQRGNRIQYKHVYSHICTVQVPMYQRGNRVQYKHVYSHICTVQVQCTRGAKEYNTNMCTLISVLCKYSVLEVQQSPIQTCVLSYLYYVQVRCTIGAIESNTNMCTLISVLCEYGVLEGQQKLQYKHVYSRICTV